MNNKLVFDKKGEFAINFSWDSGEDVYWVNFSGAEVCSDFTDKDNPKFMTFNTGSGVSSDCFEFKDVPEEDLFLSGSLKWDGCIEIYNLNYHFCYQSDVLQTILDLIYNCGREVMISTCNF